MSKRTNRRSESSVVGSTRYMTAGDGLVEFQVRIKETVLHLQADGEMRRRAEELVLESRHQIEQYIVDNPFFYSSLQPLPKDFAAPPLVKKMFDAARIAGVGPMAAVAGAIAEYVGSGLVKDGSAEVIVENGGDIYLFRKSPCRVALFAGSSPLSYRIAIELSPGRAYGVCTSSGSAGYSLNLREEDSVTVVSHSAAIADAVATRIGNEVGGEKNSGEDISRALDICRTLQDVIGVVIICGEAMGAAGGVKIIRLDT